MSCEWVTVTKGGKCKAKSKRKEFRPREVLRSTHEKENFQRCSRLLISGGTALLKEKFDQLCPPRDLPKKLADPETEDELRANLTKPQVKCVYPSAGTYGKSENFDISLLCRLLTTHKICKIPKPHLDRNDMPLSKDVSLGANIVRIRHYRNELYSHVNEEMSLREDEFRHYWGEIKNSLARIARTVSPEKEHEWNEEIENFLYEPLTVDEKIYIEELERWAKEDKERKEILKKVDSDNQKVKESVDTMGKTLEKVEEIVKELNKCKLCGKSECCQEEHKGVASLDIRICHNCLNMEGSPTTQEILNRIADLYLKEIRPSTREEFNAFLIYMKEVRNVVVIDAKEGSLILTVGCRSVQILEGLWNDYREGYLDKIAQKYLVTDEVLHEFGVSEVKLTTNISEEGYRRCRQELLLYSELEQKLAVVKDLRDGLQEKFLTWARTRESNVTSLGEFLTQLRGFSPRRAGATAALLTVAAFLTSVPALVAAAAATSVGAARAVSNKWDKQRKAKEEIIKERKVFDELQLKADSLKQPLAGLADFCQENTDSVLSSRHLEGEFHLLSRTLQKPKPEDPDPKSRIQKPKPEDPERTLPNFIKDELEKHYTSIRQPLELLSTSQNDEELSENICRILENLKVGPGEQEIRAMISSFIEKEFEASFFSRD